MLDKGWLWYKWNKKKNQEFQEEDDLLEMKKYWLTQFDAWSINKDRYKIETDKLELNYKQSQLHAQKSTKGEIALDITVGTVSKLVSWIFKMSWVGNNKNK
jgi:hypothetical protein